MRSETWVMTVEVDGNRHSIGFSRSTSLPQLPVELAGHASSDEIKQAATTFLLDHLQDLLWYAQGRG